MTGKGLFEPMGRSLSVFWTGTVLKNAAEDYGTMNSLDDRPC
jgi:hypothetical protein